MRIYLICPVREADKEALEAIADYIQTYEDLMRHRVYYPRRDAKQDDPTGRGICEAHLRAMREADEVHVIWDVESKGSHFDLGMAYAMGKPIKAIKCMRTDPPGKSYWKAVVQL